MAAGGEVASAVHVVDGAYCAPLELTYPYSRTAGAVLTRFFQGLAAGRIEGNRTADGRVHVPPVEFDPKSGERCERVGGRRHERDDRVVDMAAAAE